MEQTLMQQIDQKERELLNLKCQFEEEVEREKEKVLSSKSLGISKSLYLWGFEFVSSCERTPQYLEFHRTFKRELTQALKPYCKKIDISKPNHFDVTGFFELNDGRIFYFSLGDLRWDKEDILIRTAKGFKDYTGGSNGCLKFDENFLDRLFKYLEVEK